MVVCKAWKFKALIICNVLLSASRTSGIMQPFVLIYWCWSWFIDVGSSALMLLDRDAITQDCCWGRVNRRFMQPQSGASANKVREWDLWSRSTKSVYLKREPVKHHVTQTRMEVKICQTSLSSTGLLTSANKSIGKQSERSYLIHNACIMNSTKVQNPRHYGGADSA